ncbi:hypothetical protein DAI22_06g169100 [Oryza sativa Japonica Group]|nr:hypothetical protein DAI22_06g169100 [Oryza sativa Japonica Group]
MHAEDIHHLFFSCQFARQCWNFMGIQWSINMEFMNMIVTMEISFAQSFFLEVIATTLR